MAVETKHITRRLLVEMTQDESVAILTDVMNLLRREADIEDKKKVALAGFAAQTKEVKKKIDDLRQTVDRGSIEKDVHCELRQEGLKVVTIRLDTGAIVDVREMTDEERQGEFIFEEPVLSNIDADTLAKLLKDYASSFLDREITADEIRTWSEDTYREVERWASLLALDTDNDQLVEMPPTPAILTGGKVEKDEGSTTTGKEAEAGEGESAGAGTSDADSSQPAASSEAVDELAAEDAKLMERLHEQHFKVPLDVVRSWDTDTWQLAERFARDCERNEPGVVVPEFLRQYQDLTGED